MLFEVFNNRFDLMFSLFTAVFTVFFAIIYWKNRSRLLNGLLFTVCLFFLFATLLIWISALNQPILERILIICIVIIGLPLLLIVIFSPFILIVGSLWNAYIVYKREGLRLSNMLTLFIGLFAIFSFISSIILQRINIPAPINDLRIYMSFITAYFILHFVNYCVTAFIYRIYRPFYNKDYLIVLGSGLINGNQVPPLLASRINKAIKFYEKAVQKGYRPTFIFSGGQGSDETISEGKAMSLYALSKGIPVKDMLIENQSTTTYENMLFSKKLIEKKQAKILFFTNDFHVLRAAIYARRANLNAQGVGSKTALYFLPNAFLREFIAVIVMYKKLHIICLSLFTIIYLLFVIIPYFI